MTAALHATRMTANRLDKEYDLLAREAQDIADAASRFANDVVDRLTMGDARQIAEAAQQLALRAARVAAMQETAELFTAELAEETP